MAAHRPKGPWKLVLAFGFFGVIFAVLLTGVLVGAIPLTSGGGVIMLLAGGFVVASGGLLPVVRRGRTGASGPNAGTWVFFFAGIALWCAAPIAGAMSDAGWVGAVGGAGRRVPMWALAVLTWGAAVLLLWGFVRQLRRRSGDR